MKSMATNIFSAYASMAGSMMLFRSIANDVIPPPVKAFLYSIFRRFFGHFVDRFFPTISSSMTIFVDDGNLPRNQIYCAAEIYLPTKINPDSKRLKVHMAPEQKSISFCMEMNQEVVDWYKDVELKWQFVLMESDRDRGHSKEVRYFTLTFKRQFRNLVLNDYLLFVLAKANEIKENARGIKLFSRDNPLKDHYSYLQSINLDHPMTFNKLAMDPNLKQTIIEDLDRFVRRKDYYKTVGKAWKRGYLLYGPPGTGKSSLVAAMANYLRFDVYYLELNSLSSNDELRRAFLSTNNKSIILIEDIDCSSQMHDRDRDRDDDFMSKNEEVSRTSLTLSGLLNFIDGLWSSCGDERIIIFTTNHKKRLDPALLRPGRMDMHIHMGYCTPEGFDVLALNYLGIHDHPSLFPEIKALIHEVEISPAEIGEHLLRNEDPELALRDVIDLLKQKKKERNEVQ